MDKVRAGRACRSSPVHVCRRGGLLGTREGDVQRPLAEGDDNCGRFSLDWTV